MERERERSPRSEKKTDENPMRNREMKEVSQMYNFTEKQMQELFMKSIADILKKHISADDQPRGSSKETPAPEIKIAADFPYWYVCHYCFFAPVVMRDNGF